MAREAPADAQAGEFGGLLGSLGAHVLQRDWLSANQVVLGGDAPGQPATVVDTGYATHADMTLALLDRALGGAPLGRIVNTHLHSDHCGGNRALQARHPGVRTAVPLPSLEAVRGWDEDRLSYRLTGQTCEPFRVDEALRPGDMLRLGAAAWTVHAAPGHDPDAVLLFEPQTRTLIAGDALWQDRLAIIFPELAGEDGFGPTRRTLALIESLAPRCVIPGHGAPFGDVAAALAASRRRLDAFERDPRRHAQHAARALVMFHMLEHRRLPRPVLQQWLLATPIFERAWRVGAAPASAPRWAQDLVQSLLDDGVLQADGDALRVPASA